MIFFSSGFTIGFTVCGIRYTYNEICHKPLWHTLLDRNMRKEDLIVASGLTTNMIANMGKNKGFSMKTLAKICDTLQCDITDVIELVDEIPEAKEKE